MAEDQIGASATAARAGRRRRGQILVAAVAFIVTVWFVGAYPADRHAENIERHLRAAASAFTFTDLAPPPGPALAKLERRAGFRVWFSAPGGTIELKADGPHWTFGSLDVSSLASIR